MGTSAGDALGSGCKRTGSLRRRPRVTAKGAADAADADRESTAAARTRHDADDLYARALDPRDPDIVRAKRLRLAGNGGTDRL